MNHRTKVLLLVVVLGSCIAEPVASRAAESEVVLGMSTALTGPTAELGQAMRQGVLAGFDRVNRAGGVNGHKLRLIALDDGYEPSRCGPNMRQLIEKENVLAVIGNVGTPTGIVAIPIANEQKTLFFAPFTGAGVLRKTPPDRYVINYRTSYAEETGAMIDALILKAGLKPSEIAFFTQRDGFGDAGYVGGITALKRHGLKDESEVIHARFERNTLSVEAPLAEILGAATPPRAVVMVGTYAPCAKFIHLARQSEFNALFLNVSFVGSAPLAKELGGDAAKVIVTQVVPYPDGTDVPLVGEYREDLRRLEPGAQSGFGSLEGYIAARVFCHALERIKGSVTREAIVDALEGLGEFNLGLGDALSLSKTEHQACHRIWPTILKGGQFVPFDWKDIEGLVK
jgi:branched-chain amino acid transport system substrate-binding protein